ncbi:MAG: SagB/ThcOx family dehydrogenase [Oscillospiraceae bacterium]|jgi:SagB-type dehydrogenase family enzyme|nr:SagB/ThcOx family dehydrogenase [Oscillospiraceae bacterium]
MSKDNRNEGLWEEINNNRDFMKCPDFSKTMICSDQEKKLTQPPLSKDAKGEIIELSADFDDAVVTDSYKKLLDIRRSLRVYDKKVAMTQNQLAFLLWSTQGIQEIKGQNYATLRPVASGGARHPFETYFIVQNVEGLKPGVYHYLPLENIGEKRVAISFVSDFPEHKKRVTNMLAGQKWASDAPVVVFLSCVAYRAEWRYSVCAHRVVLIDLGHVGQNLMLSAAAMGLGSCCIAAYNQKLCDEALGLDSNEEYTVYVCTVGG